VSHGNDRRQGKYENLLWEQDGYVLTLTLNRPDHMNAISPGLEDELHVALAAAEQDASIRAIILTGAGRAFSAGYDLGDEEETVGGRRAMPCAAGGTST